MYHQHTEYVYTEATEHLELYSNKMNEAQGKIILFRNIGTQQISAQRKQRLRAFMNDGETSFGGYTLYSGARGSVVG
jgi:hypothetical protein